MTNAQVSIRQLVLWHNIRADVAYGCRAPWDSLDNWQREAHQWTVTLRLGRRRLTTDYFTGQGVATEPTAEDVLDSLISDASTYEDARDFGSWCLELGYGYPERDEYALEPHEKAKRRIKEFTRAQRIYEATARQTKKLKRFLGGHYEEFLHAERL